MGLLDLFRSKAKPAPAAALPALVGPVEVTPMVAVPAPKLAVRRKVEDAPEFAREYEAQIAPGIRLEVTMRYWNGRRTDSSYLWQTPGYECVTFDLDSIADRILDRDLLPVIQRYADEIYRLDAEFLRTQTNEFVDERGHRWRRVLEQVEN